MWQSGRRHSRSLGKLKFAVSVLTFRPEEELFLVQDQRLNTFLLWAIFALLFGLCLSPMRAQVLTLRPPQEVRQESQTFYRNHLLQLTAPPNVSFMYCLQINCFLTVKIFYSCILLNVDSLRLNCVKWNKARFLSWNKTVWKEAVVAWLRDWGILERLSVRIGGLWPRSEYGELPNADGHCTVL